MMRSRSINVSRDKDNIVSVLLMNSDWLCGLEKLNYSWIKMFPDVSK